MVDKRFLSQRVELSCVCVSLDGRIEAVGIECFEPDAKAVQLPVG